MTSRDPLQPQLFIAIVLDKTDMLNFVMWGLKHLSCQLILDDVLVVVITLYCHTVLLNDKRDFHFLSYRIIQIIILYPIFIVC